MKKLPSFSFTKHFKLFAVISILLVSLGLVSLILLPFKIYLFNLDIDFLGGVTMQVDLERPVDSTVTSEVREIVRDVTGSYPSAVTKAGETEVQIKTLELDSETRDALFQQLSQTYGLSEGNQPSTSYVSASVGKDLRNAAFSAAGLACLLILIYIVIRFELRSGIAAIVALVHDILVMLSMYVVFQIPFNINFIAVALTILGYSINATIVVFDRVRENRKISGDTPFDEVMDRSIWQTMTRSINTTLTTLFTIVTILIFGVSAIRSFALPLLIGVLSGCYSSVCIAGPVWSKLRKIGKKAA